MEKKVTHLLPAPEFPMGSMRIKQPFPSATVDYFDPFLLLHHARNEIKAGTPEAESGVGPHPHRGFSPVTFIFEGGMRHRDSLGNDSVIASGGAQWINAGRGLMHSERLPADLLEKGGILEIIQLWINSPASKKMAEPAYVPVTRADMPLLFEGKIKGEARLLAGELNGKRGVVNADSPVTAVMMNLLTGDEINLQVPSGHNSFCYLLSGALEIADSRVEPNHAVIFSKDGDEVKLKATQDSRVLFMTGEPLNEPVAAQGPFVMNTQQQIMDTFNDYRLGKFGELEE